MVSVLVHLHIHVVRTHNNRTEDTAPTVEIPMRKKNIGGTFDSWLCEEGIYEEVTAKSLKRVIARQIASAMSQSGLTKSEMAKRMNTSRASLNRLLDPDNGAITLSTLQKAASVLGRRIRLELI